jgi:hypothetical protein
VDQAHGLVSDGVATGGNFKYLSIRPLPLTELPFLLGTIVEMFLKMPAEIMGEIERESCCKGRVVRVSDADPVDWQRSVAVKFQYYEVLQKEPSDALAARAKSNATARRP